MRRSFLPLEQLQDWLLMVVLCDRHCFCLPIEHCSACACPFPKSLPFFVNLLLSSDYRIPYVVILCKKHFPLQCSLVVFPITIGTSDILRVASHVFVEKCVNTETHYASMPCLESGGIRNLLNPFLNLIQGSFGTTSMFRNPWGLEPVPSLYTSLNWSLEIVFANEL